MVGIPRFGALALASGMIQPEPCHLPKGEVMVCSGRRREGSRHQGRGAGGWRGCVAPALLSAVSPQDNGSTCGAAPGSPKREALGHQCSQGQVSERRAVEGGAASEHFRDVPLGQRRVLQARIRVSSHERSKVGNGPVTLEAFLEEESVSRGE